MEIWNPQIQVMADAAQAYIGRWFRNKPPRGSFIMAGQSGCGKTRMLLALYRYARHASVRAAEDAHWKWPPQLWLMLWPEVARAVVEAQTPMRSIIHDGLTADLLFLDDIGAESDKYKTGEAKDALCQLLSARAGKWTVITTNIAPLDWPMVFDIRIADRLNRDSEIVDMTECGSYAMR